MPILPSWHRVTAGAVAAGGSLAVTTFGLSHVRHHVNLLSAVLVYLLITVLVALAVSLLIAILTAITATLLINYFFTPPLHRFTISESANVLALLVFVFVAVVVALLVDRAERRRREAAHAVAEADTLAAVAGGVLRGESALNEFLGRLRETLSMQAVSLLEYGPEGWQAAAAAGSDAPLRPDEADTVSNLLDMSRLQAGAVLVHCQDIDLDGVIAQTLASLGPSGDSIGVDVIEGLYTVHADPGLPERVLGNLLENALRMSPADCPASIVVRAASGVVQIKVIDHGWRRSWPLSGLTMVVSLPAERPAT